MSGTKSFPAGDIANAVATIGDPLDGFMSVLMLTNKFYTNGDLLEIGQTYTVTKHWGRAALARNWAADPEGVLPEFGTPRQLTSAELTTLQRWVAAGGCDCCTGGGGGGGGPGSPLRPKWFLAPANAFETGTQAYLDGASFLAGSSAEGKTGSFTLTTTESTYGWLAVNADASASGVLFANGGFLGGWSGAGQPVDYSSGDTTNTSFITVLDSTTGQTVRLFRQDYVGSSLDPSIWTIS